MLKAENKLQTSNGSKGTQAINKLAQIASTVLPDTSARNGPVQPATSKAKPALVASPNPAQNWQHTTTV